MPTDEEIRRAKEYLVLRLSAERLAVSSLDSALLSAARRIVAISRRYNIPPERFRFSADPRLQAEVRDVLALLRDALYDRIVALPDSPERDALCRDAAKLVMDDCPWILTGYPLAFSLRRARLRNCLQTDFSWNTEKYWALSD